MSFEKELWAQRGCAGKGELRIWGAKKNEWRGDGRGRYLASSRERVHGDGVMRGRGVTPCSGARQNLWLLLATVTLVLMIGEVVARYALPAPLPWTYPQLRYRRDPNLVFTLRPRQRAFTADKPVTINDHGLRGEPVPYEPAADRMRLLFLGDSIVFGYGVNDVDVVTVRTRDLLLKRGIAAEVINAGVPSYNTEQEITYLAVDGLRYRPKWVVVGFCWNDIGEKSGVQVDEDGWLVNDGVGKPGMLAQLSASPAGYAIRNVLKRSRVAFSAAEGTRALADAWSPNEGTLLRKDVLEGRNTVKVAAGWDRVEKALHRLQALSMREGFGALLVAFPIPLKLDHPYPRSGYPGRLEEIARKEGLPFLDLEPAYQASYLGHDSLFIPYDGDHPNAAGHDLAAGEIVRFLVHGMLVNSRPSPASESARSLSSPGVDSRARRVTPSSIQ